jgi:hypothetical protein
LQDPFKTLFLREIHRESGMLEKSGADFHIKSPLKQARRDRPPHADGDAKWLEPRELSTD